MTREQKEVPAKPYGLAGTGTLSLTVGVHARPQVAGIPGIALTPGLGAGAGREAVRVHARPELLQPPGRDDPGDDRPPERREAPGQRPGGPPGGMIGGQGGQGDCGDEEN